MFTDHMSRVDEGDPVFLECHVSRFMETSVSVFNPQSGKEDELSAQGRTGSERQEHSGMPLRRDAHGRALARGPSLETLGCGEAEQTSEANACLYAETRPHAHWTPDHTLLARGHVLGGQFWFQGKGTL